MEEKRWVQLRRELEWLRRGVMARGTKQKARKQRVAELQVIKHDMGEEKVTMALTSTRLGKKVLEVEGLAKSFAGAPVFTDVDFRLDPGDRIGITGLNGAGKSEGVSVRTAAPVDASCSTAAPAFATTTTATQRRSLIENAFYLLVSVTVAPLFAMAMSLASSVDSRMDRALWCCTSASR